MMVILFILLSTIGTILSWRGYREGTKCLLWAGIILLSGFDFLTSVGICLVMGFVLGPIFIALK